MIHNHFPKFNLYNIVQQSRIIKKGHLKNYKIIKIYTSQMKLIKYTKQNKNMKRYTKKFYFNLIKEYKEMN